MVKNKNNKKMLIFCFPFIPSGQTKCIDKHISVDIATLISGLKTCKY